MPKNKHMRRKTEALILGKILQKIAPRIGASVFIEPKWKIAGRITFKSGRHSYFSYSTLDMNPLGSAKIAQDKDYANFFMNKAGYPIVPQSKTFFSKEWGATIGESSRTIDDAYRYASKIGFPVMVKPNSGSQGVGVALVYNKSEFYRAVRAVFRKDRIVLVQKALRGKDYRVVVLDDMVISAYERIPLNVVGDGISPIGELLSLKQKNFVASSRDTRIKISDPRMAIKLKHQKLSFDSIPKKGEKVFLLDNANLSTGGDSVDATAEMHPEFKKIAVALTRDMGLRLCGVDLMIKGDITEKPNRYWILEINASPGLDHYVKMGKAQEKIVEDLYLQVLKHLER